VTEGDLDGHVADDEYEKFNNMVIIIRNKESELRVRRIRWLKREE
jgi:hypothetical protein